MLNKWEQYFMGVGGCMHKYAHKYSTQYQKILTCVCATFPAAKFPNIFTIGITIFGV